MSPPAADASVQRSRRRRRRRWRASARLSVVLSVFAAAVSTDVASAFFITHHVAVTEQALGFLRPAVLERINAQHQLQDNPTPVVGFGSGSFPDRHFDDCAFRESSVYIDSQYAEPLGFFGAGGVLDELNPTDPAPFDAAEEFGQLLHTAQDFYSHSNWVELGRSDLVDGGTGPWASLRPWAQIRDGIVVGQGIPPSGWTLSRGSHSSVPTAVTGAGERFDVLTSGAFAAVGYCSPGVAISHDELNKDQADRPGFSPALLLALEQSRHEWCRLLHRLNARHGFAGSAVALTLWAKPDASPHPLGTPCAVAPAGPKKVSVSVEAINVRDDTDALGAGELNFSFVVYRGDLTRSSRTETETLSVHTEDDVDEDDFPEPLVLELESTDTLVVSLQGWDDDEGVDGDYDGSDRALAGVTLSAAAPTFGAGCREVTSEDLRVRFSITVEGASGEAVCPGSVAQRWEARIDPAVSGLSDPPTAMALGSDGSRLFAVGDAWGGRPSVGGTGYDFDTRSFDASTGRQLWTARFRGAGTEDDHANDHARDIEVARDGRRVFVTGGAVGTTTRDFTTLTYDAATGRQLWASRFDGGPGRQDVPTALAQSPDGATVYVTGTSHRPSSASEFATVAYDAATGRLLWVHGLAGSPSERDEPAGIAVSPDGSGVFVTGRRHDLASPGPDSQALTIAIESATGRTRWVSRFGVEVDGRALAVAPDGSRVFVAGSSRRPGSGADYATLAYDAASGALAWSARFDGPMSGDEEANALAVTHNGRRVIVTGGPRFDDADNPAITGGYVTLAYSGDSGELVWQATRGTDGEAGTSVHVTDDGEAIIGGFRSALGGRQKSSSTVAALEAGRGRVIWSVDYAAGTATSHCCTASTADGDRIFVHASDFAGADVFRVLAAFETRAKLSLDLEPSGNTSSELGGMIQRCRPADVGEVIEIDVVLESPALNAGRIGYRLRYPRHQVELLSRTPLAPLTDRSDPLPDGTGAYETVIEAEAPGQQLAGPSVVVRYRLRLKEEGFVPISVSDVSFEQWVRRPDGSFDLEEVRIDQANPGYQGRLAVNRSCGVVLIPGIPGSVLYDRAIGSTVFDLHSLLRLPENGPRLRLSGDGRTPEHAIAPRPDIIATNLWLPGIYQPLIDYFSRELGYTPGLLRFDPKTDTCTIGSRTGSRLTPDLFAFPYDWRLDNRVSARALKRCVDTILGETTVDGNKVAHDRFTFIAHSMGGLVARYYASVLGGSDRAERMIFLGTPNLGAMDAYVTAAFGATPALLKEIATFLSLPIEIHPVFGGPAHWALGRATSALAQFAREITGNLPSLYQTLPTQAYFNVTGGILTRNGELRSTPGETYAALEQWAPNIRLLADAQDFWQEMDAWHQPGKLGTDVFLLNGIGLPTTSHAIVAGKRVTVVVDEFGDGTVQFPSQAGLHAAAGHARVQLTMRVVHAKMPADPVVQANIGEIIRRTNRFVGQVPEAVARSVLTVTFTSDPVTLEVFDRAGRRIGPVAGGISEVGIDGASYFQAGTAPTETVVLPPTEPYRIVVSATGPSDSFVLELDRHQADTADCALYHADVRAPAVAELLYEPDGESFSTLRVDADGDGSFERSLAATAQRSGSHCPLGRSDTTPPVVTARISPEANATGWRRNDVEVKWTVTDPESGIVAAAGCDPVVVGETAGTTLRCSATNGAGASHSESVTVRNDKSPPALTATVKPAADRRGWRNGPVTVTFRASDALSGIAHVSEPVRLRKPAAAQVATGRATDRAGNTATKDVIVSVRAIRVRLSGTRIRVDERRMARLRLRCLGVAKVDCRGTVTLRRGRTVIGRNSFTLRPQRSGTAMVRLTRSAFGRLVRLGRVRAQVVVRARDPVAGAERQRRSILLLAPFAERDHSVR